MPRVTVVVPVFNGAPHLAETICALLSQTEPVDVLAYDDASRDDSLSVLEALACPRLRIVRGSPNIGLAGALNAAIGLVTTEFVARNDQDDLSLPHRLRTQLGHLDAHPEADVVFSNYLRFGTCRQTPHHRGDAGFHRWRAGQGTLLASTMCGRTPALVTCAFREDYYPADDLDLELRLSQRGEVHYLHEALVRYRMHGQANSYRVFAQMQQRGRWAVDSHARRMDGMAERTFPDFLAAQGAGRRAAVTASLSDFSALQARRAGQALLDGRGALFAVHAGAALLSDPRLVVDRATRRWRTPGPHAT